MALTVDIDRIGALVSTIGSPTFGTRYFDLFQQGLSVDQCTVFAFKGEQPPDPLILEGRSAEMRQIAHALASEYMAGAFAEDPNVRSRQQGEGPTVHCLRADEVRNRAYRLRFYDEPHLAHELVVLGQTEDILYYSSFYRCDRRAAFQARDLEMVTGLASFAVRALHRHLELLGGAGPYGAGAILSAGAEDPSGRRRAMATHLRDVLLAEPYALSPREAEVCAGIILGYTTLGISLNFGISVNTVATHRKRAYRKLGICSQNELFSRYFQLVNQHARVLSHPDGGEAASAA